MITALFGSWLAQVYFKYLFQAGGHIERPVLRWRPAMELAGVNALVDVCAPGSFVKKAVATRAKYHLPDFTGKSEWTITPDAVASRPSNRNGVRMKGQRSE